MSVITTRGRFIAVILITDKTPLNKMFLFIYLFFLFVSYRQKINLFKICMMNNDLLQSWMALVLWSVRDGQQLDGNAAAGEKWIS